VGKKINEFVHRKQVDFLTILEKNWRDWFLKPLTLILFKFGISANLITTLGFILIFGGVIGHIYEIPIQYQFFIVLLAALSDLIDGPRARNHNEVTALGTWLDHIRDGFLIAWVTYLVYAFKLLPSEWLIVLWVIQLVMTWIIVKDFLIGVLQKPMNEWHAFAHRYSFSKLQASVIGRLQFFFWNLGYIALLFFLLLPNPILILLGKSFLALTIVFASLNTYKIYATIR